MTGKELKALLDNMTEEELEMEVVFDADVVCTGEDGEELYTPSNIYADEDDDAIVIEGEPVEQ